MGHKFTFRGVRVVKGKGEIITYFLQPPKDKKFLRPESALKKTE